jgi:hypothetical protein
MCWAADRERSSDFLTQSHNSQQISQPVRQPPALSALKCKIVQSPNAYMLLNVQDLYSKFMLLSSDWYCFRHI